MTDELSKSIYYPIFDAHFIYACKIWGQNSHQLTQRVHLLQEKALRIITFKGITPSTRAIYKTRNTGMGNGIRGTQGMKIPGNVSKDSGVCSQTFWGMCIRIPANLIKFRGMFLRIPGNVSKDSGECSQTFWGMCIRIPGNLIKYSGECL